MDCIVVRPDDILAEARGNLWSFSLSPEQLAVVKIEDIERFAAAVADARRVWLARQQLGPMILYWWSDRQAGQLRFSLVSAVHERLPFSCEVDRTATLETVAAEWLTPDESDAHSKKLPVWSVTV